MFSHHPSPQPGRPAETSSLFYRHLTCYVPWRKATSVSQSVKSLQKKYPRLSRGRLGGLKLHFFAIIVLPHDIWTMCKQGSAVVGKHTLSFSGEISQEDCLHFLYWTLLIDFFYQALAKYDHPSKSICFGKSNNSEDKRTQAFLCATFKKQNGMLTITINVFLYQCVFFCSRRMSGITQ